MFLRSLKGAILNVCTKHQIMYPHRIQGICGVYFAHFILYKHIIPPPLWGVSNEFEQVYILLYNKVIFYIYYNHFNSQKKKTAISLLSYLYFIVL